MTTELRVERRWFSPDATIGELLAPDRTMLAFTLEDAYRGDDPAKKVPGKTAIPCGRYKVVRDWSPKFNRQMLHLLDVPGFSGIRIHAGNTPADTDGCIIIGKARMADKVLHSLDALKFVDAAVDAYLAKGAVWVTVAGSPAGQLVC